MIYKTKTKNIKSFKDDIVNDKEIESCIKHFDIWDVEDRDFQKIVLMFKNDKINEDIDNKEKMKITSVLRYLLQDKFYSDSKYLEIEIDDYFNIQIICGFSLENLKKRRKLSRTYEQVSEMN